jgi:hypothetical protein
MQHYASNKSQQIQMNKHTINIQARKNTYIL